MQMTLRWYGSSYDTVTLEQIRQIPGVKGVITTLYDTAPGDVWPQEKIHQLKMEVEAAGLKIAGIESVNVHEAIKAGLSEREQYIENYIATLENLSFIHDWTQTGQNQATFSIDHQALDELLKELNHYQVQKLEILPPTLEELFMRHYQVKK